MSSTRRDFLTSGVGVASLTALHANMASAAEATQTQPAANDDGGGRLYDAVWPHWVPRQVPTPQNTILFMDWRHIQCGRLKWYSPDGAALSLHPGGSKVDAHSKPQKIAYGIRLAAQPAQKSEPISGLGDGHMQIMYENGVYRMWRWGGGIRGDLFYSESTDGFEWRKLRKVFSFSQMSGVTDVSNLTVFKDPKGPGDERYKAMWCSGRAADDQEVLRAEFNKAHPRYRNNVVAGPGMGMIGMYAAVSPDGIEWKFVPRHVLVHYNEGGTTVYYDQWLDKYVIYARVYLDDRRIVARGETSDFYHWPLRMEPVLWPSLEDSFAMDIYNNARSEYPGLSQYHLMFPYFYERDTERSSVRLFVSRDGILWDRVPGEPVIAPGEAGSSDSEFIGSQGQLVPFGSDRVGILWGGTRYPHKYPRWPGILGAWQTAWASWPRGRLAGIVADEAGEFFTFPLLPTGAKLTINARTRRGGEIRVGIVGPGDVNDKMVDTAEMPGRTVADCAPIFGDSLAHQVVWKTGTDVAIKPGQAVALHFQMRNAELFAASWTS